MQPSKDSALDSLFPLEMQPPPPGAALAATVTTVSTDLYGRL